MGKRISLVLLPLLALTACATEAATAPAPAATVTVTATPEAAPITAEAAPAETAGPGEFGNPEDDGFFIKSAAPALLGGTPSDAELIGAAKLACEQMDGGTPWDAVQVISGLGADDAHNNEVIGQYASQIYCPQHSPF